MILYKNSLGERNVKIFNKVLLSQLVGCDNWLCYLLITDMLRRELEKNSIWFKIKLGKTLDLEMKDLQNESLKTDEYHQTTEKPLMFTVELRV